MVHNYNRRKTHKITAKKHVLTDKMVPYYNLVRQVEKYIREKLENEDLEDDTHNPLTWDVLMKSIEEKLNSLYCKLNKIPYVVKYPKPRPGSNTIPPLDGRIGIQLQVLTYLKKYFERQSNRTFALLHDSDEYPLRLHLFDSTPLDKLIHKYRYIIDFHDMPILPDPPFDLQGEAEAILKELNLKKKVWLPHFQNFYREQMKILQNRRDRGQYYYRHVRL